MYVARPNLLIYLRRQKKVWHDYTTLNMTGQVLNQLTIPGDYWMFQYSPDGKYLARSGGDFLLYDIDRGVDELISTQPLPFHFDWSPDSGSFVYLAYPEGNLYERFVKSDESVILRDSIARGASYPEWLPDRSAVLLILTNQNSQAEKSLWKYPIGPNEQATQLLKGEANVFMARVSPDGRWIAYVGGSTSSKKEVFIRPFPAMTTRIPVSTTGGNFPNWSQDSSRLWYMNSTGRLELVDVDNTGSVTAPVLVSERIVSFFPTVHLPSGFTVHPDGDKVFVSDNGLRYDLSEIVIWSNWQSTLSE